jgi:hypothetical protein
MLAATRTVDGNIPVTDATRAQRGTFIVSASALHPDVVELPGADDSSREFPARGF